MTKTSTGDIKKTSIKATRKQPNFKQLEKMLSEMGFSPVAQKQNKANVYVSLKALENYMRTLGHQPDLFIGIKCIRGKYTTTVYLPENKIIL